jgi:hypothetical protein
MMRLPRERYQAARDFLKSRARRVDCALFEFRFEKGSSETVVEAVEEFQNDDGGFGQALEPDLRSPSSSGLATAHALDVLREVGCDWKSPVMKRCIHYVLETFDPQSKVWPVAPDDVNDYPHAPWWHEKGDSLEQIFDGYQIIPRALIIASLHSYLQLLPFGWLEEVTENTVRFIESAPVDALRSDGFVWAAKLAQAAGLSVNSAGRLNARLVQIITEVVSTDPAEWSGYCLPPLKAAPSPDALAAPQLDEAIQAHLDYTISSQSEDGSWNPYWDWGECYPEAWKVAKEEWRGQLTLEYLSILRSYKRLTVQ